MKITILLFVVTGLLVQSNIHGQEVQLSLALGFGVVRISHETIAGSTYELQQSADLSDWQGAGPAKAGDGQTAIHEIELPTAGARFFRLSITGTPVGNAPTETEAVALFVGTTLGDGYNFSSSTRFDWRGEDGDWSYEKTGPDTALLVFTYDEDGNDPGLYREEVLLTFATPTSGSYRYSEYNRGVENPWSVGVAPFSL
jgi:hypothetical protein